MDYEVSAPDGRKFRVTAPEGATQDEVLNYAKSNWERRSSSSEIPAASPEKFVPSGEKDLPSWTSPEGLAANPVTRFAVGAASPILGAAQTMAHYHPASLLLKAAGLPTGAEQIDQQLAQLESMKEEGRKQQGSEGIDWTSGAGSALSPAFLKAAKIIEPAASVLGRIGQGAGIGGTGGFTAPVTSAPSEGEFGTQKALQTVLGAILGGGITAGTEAARAGYGAVRDIADLFLPGGAGRIATRYNKSIVGEQDLPDVVDKLRNAQELVPGSKPTAAEAVASSPAGSPIISQQKITASTPGGPSARFGERKLEQQAALEAEKEARNLATKPLREAALEQANANGGVRRDVLLTRIDELASAPGNRASTVVQKALKDVTEKIESLPGLNPNTSGVNAADIYMIRKELGNTIQTFAKESSNWDKRFTASLERDIQKAIDKSITEAGGIGWENYLSEFAKRSQGIEADKARRLLAMRPPQRTELGGGVNVAEETRTHFPNMLSRPVMLANALLKVLAGRGQGIEPKIDAIMAEQFLNPSKLAESLSTSQSNPEAIRRLAMYLSGSAPATLGRQ